MTLKPVTGFYALLILFAVCIFSQSAPAQTTPSAQITQNAAQSDKDFQFEVVSIRPRKENSGLPFGTGSNTPNGTHLEGISMYYLLLLAYSPVGGEQYNEMNVINAPSWIQSERYDIDARVSPEDQELWQNLRNQRTYRAFAMRHVLTERCKAKVHLEPTLIPYFSLRIDEHHNKLGAVSEIPPAPDGVIKFPSGGYVEQYRDQDGNFVRKFYGCTMGDLVNILTGTLGKPIQDKTSLTGRYNYQYIDMNDAVKEQEDLINAASGLRKLGLRITNDKGPGYNLVVDHIERPDPN